MLSYPTLALPMAKFSYLSATRAQLAQVPPVLEADLSGKTVVVTGANVGLGFETAAYFARMRPGKLVIACRNKDKGQAAVLRAYAYRNGHTTNFTLTLHYASELKAQTGCKDSELRLVDLSKFESVLQFIDTFEAENSRLDILVCNAAIETTIYEAAPSGWESTYVLIPLRRSQRIFKLDICDSLQVSHLSTSLLALLLVPRLDKTAHQFGFHPRLVIVSSGVHFFASISHDVIACTNILDRLSNPNYCTPQYVVWLCAQVRGS